MFDYYFKMVAQFIDDMRKQKLRCVLTMSGITWGTMSVILLLSFGESFKAVTLKSMTGMGHNIVIMGGGRTTLTHAGMPPGRWIRLREETATLLKDNISGIDWLSPERFHVITPRETSSRGCQLSLLVHERPEELLSALKANGVVCDFRRPNVIRAAPVPLYNTFHDVWAFARVLAQHDRAL